MHRASVRTLTLCAVLSLPLFLGACRQVLGLTDFDTGDRDGEAPAAGGAPSFVGRCDGVRYRDETCRDCIDENCCDATDTCVRDPGCAALARCLAECAGSDLACRTRCNLGIRRTAAMSTLAECAASECATCGAARTTFGGVACGECLEDLCPDGMASFRKSAAALELDACQQDCPLDVREQCACTAYEGGAPVLAEVSDCAKGKCSVACEQADWSCLGAVVWPKVTASSPPLELHARVTVIEDPNRPLGDADFTACSKVDFECTSPLGPASPTDPDGWATLLLGPSDAGRYLGSIRVHFSAADEPPALLYLFPPPTRTPAWAVRRVVTRAIADQQAGALGDAGVPLDWTNNGGIIWSVSACNGRTERGIRVSLPGEEVRYLTEGFTLSPTLEETSANGLGAILNVAEGVQRITVKLRDGRQVGAYEVYVAAGSITSVALVPAPESD